ncbi:MAG: cytochrome c [Candidatus Scalindua sp.]|nr:cytochrome c [Candidatus Scalindua sp.]MCR4344843.1 cytochrome c [Candidatus Scalindua sp.]
MRNYVTGVICFIFMIGIVLKIANGSEEKEPFITLMEKEKVYLATSKSTFQYYCGPCHGENADGKGIFFTIDLEPRPRDLTDVGYMSELTDDYLQNFITNGSAAMEKSDLCPPWGGTLEENKIKGIISFLRSLTIAKTRAGNRPAEQKAGKEETVKVSSGETQGTPKAIIWSILIVSCSFLVFAAINEWKKLNIEEVSKNNNSKC